MTATLQEVPGTGIIPVDALKAETVFGPGGVDLVVDQIKALVGVTVRDVSTKKGRELIASVAYKVTRSKTALVEIADGHAKALRQQATNVGRERDRMCELLDGVRDDYRKPLTDWETAEKTRTAAHEAAIAEIVKGAAFETAEPTVGQIEARIAWLRDLPHRAWEEYAGAAGEAKQNTADTLAALLDAARKRDADAAELAEYRRQKAERDRQAHEQAAAEPNPTQAEPAGEKPQATDRPFFGGAAARVASPPIQAAPGVDAATRLRVQQAVQDALVERLNLTPSAAAGIVFAVTRGQIPHLAITY